MSQKLTLITSLSASNKQWLLDNVVDYEEVVPFLIHPEPLVDQNGLQNETPIVISSRYAVEQVQLQGIPLYGRRLFAIGSTTTKLAAEAGLKVEKSFNYLGELATWMANRQEHHLIHLSGDLSVPGIESVFEKLQIDYRRLVLYRKEICYQSLGTATRTLLFFSPSGVDSIKKQNVLDGRHSYGAIGETTRVALSRVGVTVSIIPEEPNFKSFISSALHYQNRIL